MKVIFLDVDGVLNSLDDLKIYREKNNIQGCILYDHVEDRPLKLLREIIDVTDAKIVISSSWRLGYLRNHKETIHDSLFNKLENRLKDYDITIYDVTPSLPYGYERGDEIHKWLEDHTDVENFIIFDDDSDMSIYSSTNNFLQTTYEHGLTEEIRDKAIQILNEEITKHE